MSESPLPTNSGVVLGGMQLREALDYMAFQGDLHRNTRLLFMIFGANPEYI